MRLSTFLNQANGSILTSSHDETKFRSTAAVLPPLSLVVPPFASPPSLHLDHMKICTQMSFAVYQLRQFPERKAMTDGYSGAADVGFEIGIDKESFYVGAGDGVGTVKHVEGQMRAGGFLQAVDHSAGVVVETGSDVLYVVDQRIDAFEHFGSEAVLRSGVQAVDGQLRCGIDCVRYVGLVFHTGKACSGEKSSCSFTPAASIRSMFRFPSRLNPVWLVIRPMCLPASGATDVSGTATANPQPILRDADYTSTWIAID